MRPQATGEPDRERLVTSDKFVLDRLTVDGKREVGGDGRCHVLACIDGDAGPLATGGTALLPAVARLQLQPPARAVVLDICLP
jgi:hypothetical protein